MINKTKLVADRNGFIKGHVKMGGREKGTKNKFTLVKKRIVELFEDGKAYDKLKKIMSTEAGAFKVTKDIILPILPKDPVILNEGDTHITYVWSGDKDSRDQVQPSRLSAGKP